MNRQLTKGTVVRIKSVSELKQGKHRKFSRQTKLPLGWVGEMKKYCGRQGVINKPRDQGEYLIDFEDIKHGWWYNRLDFKIERRWLSNRPCEILSQQEINALLGTVCTEPSTPKKSHMVIKDLRRSWTTLEQSNLDIMCKIDKKLDILFNLLADRLCKEITD